MRWLLLLLALSPAQAQEFRLDRPPEQGNIVIVTPPAGAVSLSLDGQPVPIDGKGDALIGFGRDAPAQANLSALMPDGSSRMQTLSVIQRSYAIQKVDGLPPRTVVLSPEDQERRKGEVEKITAARSQISALDAWKGPFRWPASGRMSGVYGSQRIRNGVPGSPHNGVDVAAPAGAPVIAPADAVVRLAEPDMLLEGGLIILDHGGGLFSDFLHLSRIDVMVGQEVKTGELIGAVGSTGRATGPHLHWGMKWREARLDPVKVGKLAPPEPPEAGKVPEKREKSVKK